MKMMSALASGVLLLALLQPAAQAFPVASDAATYTACGRVFPDPHAFWPSPEAPPVQSPWAKGNVSCRAVDFLPYSMTIQGLEFLASDEMFGDFIEIYDLSDPDGPLAHALDFASGEGMSAGLPATGGTREQEPMRLIRVTDENDTTIPIEEREHFVYTLSIHGIERAGIEGGIRAIEDLATWASCEKHGDGSPANCAQEDAGPDNPHPILETLPAESVTAGDALKRSSVWFVISNPDGWRRGSKQDGGFFFQRYNGNGMDMNRDWPTRGWTFRPFTPWSEPENRATGKALKAIKPKWTGGVDLHGQLIDRAFSFTLIGGAERPFGKDRRVLQYVRGAWSDAEQKLAWNPLIKGNDEPEPCVSGVAVVSDDPDCDATNRIYGVQWGTVWDTLAYQVSGLLGDWIDSPIGLDADGVDNEMSLSHLANCGVGTCYLTDFEQMHVDGNKSLIYAMIHYALVPEDQTFRYQGRVGYLYNPRIIADAGRPAVEGGVSDYEPQDEFDSGMQLHTGGDSVFEFDVAGPAEQVYNGGLFAEFTFTNVQGVSAGGANEIAIDRQLEDGEEPDPQRGNVAEGWQTMNTYFNQAVTYAQGGARIDVNGPPPGRYRLRVTGPAPVDWSARIAFTEEASWPDPGQVAFEATNMAFFEMLADYVPDADSRLVKLPVDDVLSGAVNLHEFDTVIAVDDAYLPGYQIIRPLGKNAIAPSMVRVQLAAPGGEQRGGANSRFHEFEVPAGLEHIEAAVSYAQPGNVDLYLQRLQADGSWSADLAKAESFALRGETLPFALPAPGRYRLELVNKAAPEQSAEMSIQYHTEGSLPQLGTVIPLDPYPGDNIDTRVRGYTRADRDQMAALTKDFVAQGGNLVLTDSSIRALEWMKLLPTGSANLQAVYAGYVQFEYPGADGNAVVTYDDPLAANLNQPGAAEGPNHRHQVTEPIPVGFAIEDLNASDFPTSPQWALDSIAWNDAGGRTVGTVTDSFHVTLGELAHGKGVVRVLGTLLPFPTDTYDHPYGVSNYALSYSGYELAQNLLSWERPAAPPETEARRELNTPSRGGPLSVWLLALLLVALIWRLRPQRLAR